jgi:biofilm PGA synthesis protein PgaD
MATRPDELHIDMPELLSGPRRVGDALATGFMWMVYSYLWAPLVSLLAWLLGFEFAYDVMIRAGGLRGFKAEMYWYGLMLLGIITVVTGWSMLNRYRFSRISRRNESLVIGDAEITEFYGITNEQLEAMRKTRMARLSISEDGSIVQVADAEAQRDDRGQSTRSQLKNASNSAA